MTSPARVSSRVCVSASLLSRLGLIFARPKSRSFTPCGVTRIFAGFRSRWINALLVRGFQGVQNLRSVFDGLRRGERTPERSAIDVLHHQVIRADVVERADVGMIQRGHGARFALEAFRRIDLLKP